MNIELAEAFLRNIYDTHTPSQWGDCQGEHEVYGFESESPRYPCELYKGAAGALELPVIEWVRPPKSETEGFIIPQLYLEYTRQLLTERPIWAALEVYTRPAEGKD